MKDKFISELIKYHGIDDDEQTMVNMTIEFLRENKVYLGEGNSSGHLTGSAWIINLDKTKVLLTHHFKLDMWIQLGGHTETDETVYESAYREGIEESGLDTLINLSDTIFDVDVHLIPERKNVKAHYHYDIRYLFQTDDKIPFNVSEESHDLAWIRIDEIEQYSSDRSILRMIEKTGVLS